MNVKLYYLDSLSKINQELELIKSLCDFEGIQYELCSRIDKDFTRYYRGNSVVITTVHNEKNYSICGFWNFIDFIQKNGLIRC